MDRSEAPHRYAIHGGREGKKRLDVLARVMLPTTARLLEWVGLTKGVNCMDVGCGGGHVAILMAGMIGTDGHVVGTDTDGQILELARDDAQTAKVANVEFQELDACTGELQEKFDLVYARFLLSHLNKPEKCLAKMVQACLPGGTIVIEDTDFAASFCYPNCLAYQRYIELYQEVVQRGGGNPNIGPKLPAMFRSVGIKEVELNIVQPVHIHGEGKLMAPLTMSRISDALISERLATEDEVQQILIGLNRAAADRETVMSLPRIFQVWGQRTV
jgi:SAM-dependent methyltransferase